jgi:hypothetical protein
MEYSTLKMHCDEMYHQYIELKQEYNRLKGHYETIKVDYDVLKEKWKANMEEISKSRKRRITALISNEKWGKYERKQSTKKNRSVNFDIHVPKSVEYGLEICQTVSN